MAVKKPAAPPSVLPPLPVKPRTVRDLMKSSMTRNIRVLVVVEDCSGSMSSWAANRSSLVARLREHMLAHYRAVAGRLFVVYVGISGGFLMAGPSLIADLEQPAIRPNGSTPLRDTLKALRERLAAWLNDEVVPAEVTVKELLTVFFGDALPDRQELAEAVAEAGEYRKFMDDWGGKISVIGPGHEHMCWEVVDALGVKREEVKQLDSTDPDSILKWTIESVSGRGLSDPGVTNAAKG